MKADDIRQRWLLDRKIFQANHAAASEIVPQLLARIDVLTERTAKDGDEIVRLRAVVARAASYLDGGSDKGSRAAWAEGLREDLAEKQS